MSDNFSNIVDSLVESGTESLYIQKRIPGITIVDAYAAKKVESGLAALLLLVDGEFLKHIEQWPECDGFTVMIRSASSEGNGSVLLSLDLKSDRYREIFLTLAEDLCSVLQRESIVADALIAFHRRLYRWQHFLKKHRPEGLSSEMRAGLFAELTLLNDLFFHYLMPLSAVEGWRGCKKANQDFQYPGFALEAKSSRSANPDFINISNIRQLDEDGIDEMYLVILLLNENESNGESLPRLIEKIREVLPDPAVDLFNEGLMEVGYLDLHEGLYKNELYQVKNNFGYRVLDGFPRVKHSELPDGVGHVKYKINLAACRDYLVTKDEIEAAVKSLGKQLQDE